MLHTKAPRQNLPSCKKTAPRRTTHPGVTHLDGITGTRRRKGDCWWGVIAGFSIGIPLSFSLAESTQTTGLPHRFQVIATCRFGVGHGLSMEQRAKMEFLLGFPYLVTEAGFAGQVKGRDADAYSARLRVVNRSDFTSSRSRSRSRSRAGAGAVAIRGLHWRALA